MSVASINAALNATPPAGGGKREFFFLPGTYGDPSITPATATTNNVIQAEVAGDITNVRFTPVIREAPFVYYDGRRFQVFRPSAQFNVRGPDWSTAARQGDSLPLSSFYIATVAAGDNAETMNAALASGKNLLLDPGTYVLDAPLTIAKPDKVVMGLGDPILRADNTATLVVKNSAPSTVLSKFDADGRAFDPADMGPFAPNQVVIGDTPHGAGSRNAPTALTDVSSVSGSTNGFLLNQNYAILNQGEIQTNNNSGDGYTTTNWAASKREHRRHRQRGPQHLAGHLARALQEDRDHMER